MDEAPYAVMFTLNFRCHGYKLLMNASLGWPQREAATVWRRQPSSSLNATSVPVAEY